MISVSLRIVVRIGKGPLLAVRAQPEKLQAVAYDLVAVKIPAHLRGHVPRRPAQIVDPPATQAAEVIVAMGVAVETRLGA
jgi:hypothetical protein